MIRQTLVETLAPALERYSYILIDCPPGLSVFSSAALIASDYFVSPIIPEPLSLQGVRLVRDRADQLRQTLGAKAEFKGVILNIVKHYRNTHSRISNELYTSRESEYFPFRFWVPDNERLRTLGEFDPDISGSWAMGIDRKFSSLHEKYNVQHYLTNPKIGHLSREAVEGPRYRLAERIALLTEEFQEKCSPTI